MFKFLVNRVYIYFLTEYKGEKIIYSSIAKKIGLNRNTVCKKIQELEERGVVKIVDDRAIVYNICDLDVDKVRQYVQSNYSDAVIGYLCLKSFKPDWSERYICSELGISQKTLENHKEELEAAGQLQSTKNIIYAIIYDNKVKYVGSTYNLENRMFQHLKKRPYLTEDNFIILEECDIENRYDRELYYIKLFQPEWNTVGIT